MQEFVYYGAGHELAGQIKEIINHPARPTAPVVFDSADWKRYTYAVLGSIAAPEGSEAEQLAAGMSRYGAILKGARASTDNFVVAAVDQYDSESRFRKDQVIIFLQALNDDGEIVTDAEYAAIVAGWSEQ